MLWALASVLIVSMLAAYQGHVPSLRLGAVFVTIDGDWISISWNSKAGNLSLPSAGEETADWQRRLSQDASMYFIKYHSFPNVAEDGAITGTMAKEISVWSLPVLGVLIAFILYDLTQMILTERRRRQAGFQVIVDEGKSDFAHFRAKHEQHASRTIIL